METRYDPETYVEKYWRLRREAEAKEAAETADKGLNDDKQTARKDSRKTKGIKGQKPANHEPEQPKLENKHVPECSECREE